ncbi:MAG: HipA domain-containing protein [Bifidobacteriaceae bacterium]|jgi:serine/threonine-protein kinase HipA|nr:HipA domain-containing protein [Bifidobacteriaceae bacterium]
MAELAVLLYGAPVGVIQGDDWRAFDFRVVPAAFDRFEMLSTALSESIPLSLAPPRGDARKRRNFFAELLPEGPALRFMAERARVAPEDVVGLLRRYGRDVAGAVEVFDPASGIESHEPDLRRLAPAQVREIATAQAATPLGNDPDAGRTSLGGVQGKIALALVDGRWNQPLGGFPSTHIVKPASPERPAMVFDEEYGARIARRLALLEYETWIEDFAGLDALVVERYDRGPGNPPARVHQEDMNQALGASGNQKYQEHGGVVTLRRIAAVLSRYSAADAVRLLRLVVLAAALGNLDLHAKNISILRPEGGPATLAPAYDMVPWFAQPTDGRLALAVNGLYRLADLTGADLAAEGEAWGIEKAAAVVGQTLEATLAAVAAEVPHPQAHPDLRPLIEANTRRLALGR